MLLGHTAESKWTLMVVTRASEMTWCIQLVCWGDPDPFVFFGPSDKWFSLL
uniref:Uncharacterized protein n=1 Tax=Peronospora matthiolae TaxID=2874970 RepID=A0AAV1VLW6_9STRA